MEIRAEWGASVLGHVLAAWVHRVAQHATLTVAAEDDVLARGDGCRPFAARLLEDATRGHVIVPFWSVQQVVIALLAAERFGLRAALSRFEVVVDNSYPGEVMRYLGKRLGLHMRCLRVRGDPRRFLDIGEWMRSPAPFFIAVDGGREYGSVPTGIVRLAARLGSTVWPIAVMARSTLRVPGLPVAIPMPGTKMALALASPLKIERAGRVVESAETLRRGLVRASGLASAIITQADRSATHVSPVL